MKAIDFTYELLFSKNKNREYKYINDINPLDTKNVLYGKEIFIPDNIDKGRNYLFQALGYIGAYGNNNFDESIHYMFMPNKTIDTLLLGVKDNYVSLIENICTKQKHSYKDPKRWSFNLTFILENEVVNFIKNRSEQLAIDQIEKYERSY